MTQQEMYKKIQQCDKKIQCHKAKRIIKLFLGVAVVFFLMDFYWLKNSILDSLIGALFFSVLYLLSGIIIWVPFIHASDSENKQLEDMKKEYKMKFSTTWY